jgi:peptide/nickel transport system substrate-binding protein
MSGRSEEPMNLEERLSVAVTRRRFLAGTLSASLGLTLLAACGEEDETDGSEEEEEDSDDNGSSAVAPSGEAGAPGLADSDDEEEDPEEEEAEEDDEEEESGDSDSEVAADLSPERRETLEFIVPNFPQASWPYLRGAPVGGVTYYWSVWESLYQTDNSDPVEFVPALAVSSEISEDGLTFDFELRDDVLFHNGDPMTAEDVAWSINEFRMGVYAWYSQGFGDGEAEVTGEYSVRVNNEHPDHTLINNLAWQGWILPKNYWEEVGGEDGFAAAPIGTGPYQTVDFVPDDVVSMESFDDHWRGEEPYFKKFNIRYVPEPSTSLVMLQSGEADVVWGSTPRTFEDAREEEGLKGIVVSGGRVTYYGMNQAQVVHWGLDDPRVVPFADKRVRQAANYAINREELAREMWLGHVTPQPSSISPSVLRPAEDLEPYPYDPDRARELLAEAGYPDGFDTLLVGWATGGYVLHQDMDQAIIAYLGDVGIRVELQLMETGARQEYWDGGDVNVNPLDHRRRGATVRHPSTVGLDISCPVDPGDSAKFCHEDIERRMVEGRAILDVEEMREHYRELDRDIYEEAPWIFLWDDPDYFLMREEIDWKIVGGTNYRHLPWTARRS